MGGMTGLLLLLWIGVTLSSVVDLQKRIIGGRNCTDNERLYHVKLTNSTGYFICGGSLINKTWVLTAAHCWVPGIKAVVGVHPGSKSKTLTIKAPRQTYVENNEDHDIMLLKLPETTEIDPVKLPDCTKPPPIGTPVQIAGHASKSKGLNNEREPGESDTLQCVNINVVDCTGLRNHLIKNYQNYYEGVQHQHWRCYQTLGVDACYGDSGGGVIYDGRIYGVHKFIGSHTHACVKPAAFMDICYPKYNKWIRDTIAK